MFPFRRCVYAPAATVTTIFQLVDRWARLVWIYFRTTAAPCHTHNNAIDRRRSSGNMCDHRRLSPVPRAHLGTQDTQMDRYHYNIYYYFLITQDGHCCHYRWPTIDGRQICFSIRWPRLHSKRSRSMNGVATPPPSLTMTMLLRQHFPTDQWSIASISPMAPRSPIGCKRTETHRNFRWCVRIGPTHHHSRYMCQWWAVHRTMLSTSCSIYHWFVKCIRIIPQPIDNCH